MKTLDDAWRWYEGTRRLVRLMRRMTDRYWEQLPWDELGRDDAFKSLEVPDLLGDADFSLAELDDLAVIVLFSVFEAQVRDSVKAGVELDAAGIRHPALEQAVKDAVERIELGSFYWVLRTLKRADADLVEQVNQVRQYRNWAAHGKRGPMPSAVDPRMAFERLRRFLHRLEAETSAA